LKGEIGCKGTTNFSNVQTFRQEKLLTITESYPKQKCKPLVYSDLHFLQGQKVARKYFLLTIAVQLFKSF
jgi:hypothetical protein